MNLKHLQYFIAVAEELNIGRAAERLHISQPPLSRQIQQLEDELGTTLFFRTPKGVELTQAGEVLLADARNIHALIDRTIERTQRAGEGKLGRIDIGIFGTGIFSTIPELLKTFRKEFPGVQMVIHTMTKDEQMDALRQHRINIAFNRMITPQNGMTCEQIIQEELLLAVEENHPLNEGESVSFKSLKKYPLVLFPTGVRPNFMDLVIQLCRRKGFMPEINQVVGDTVSAIALCASGFGISVVPKSATNLKIPGIVYLPFNDEPCATIDLSCIYMTENKSSTLQSFLKVIRNVHVKPNLEVVDPVA